MSQKRHSLDQPCDTSIRRNFAKNGRQTRERHMSQLVKLVAAAIAVYAILMPPRSTAAQTTPAIPPSIITPDKVESRLGTLEFRDGVPGKATLEKAYDYIDFAHAYDAFVNTMQGVSLVAARRGFLDAGVKD